MNNRWIDWESRHFNWGGLILSGDDENFAMVSSIWPKLNNYFQMNDYELSLALEQQQRNAANFADF